MAVNILYDAAADMAVLYDSTSDWAFGPVFYGDVADEKAVAFRAWFWNGGALERAVQLGISPQPYAWCDGDDPRDFTAADLERLYGEWRDLFCDPDGNLLDTAVSS